MRHGRLLLGWAVTACFLCGASTSAKQNGTDVVQRLENHSVAPGGPDWDSLHKLIVQSFPDAKGFTESSGPYYVWRIRDEDLVFQTTNPASTDGGSSCAFLWFDLHGAPLANSGFNTGHRMFYQNCSLVSVPGISHFVIETTLSGPVSKPVREDFGLDGYRPVLVRYATAGAGLLQNPQDNPDFTCGPKPPPYVRTDLLDALNGANPLLQLEALTWLAGRHSSLSADITDIVHEPIADSVRFWSISNDTSVSQAAGALESSQLQWVSQAAKFYVSVSKPQTVPNQSLEPHEKTMLVKDLKVGKGGDFDDKDRTVKFGDRIVVQYEIRLLTGVLLFTDFGNDLNPSIFTVGSDQVIDGLTQGLMGMKVGSIRVLKMPARLAYGDAGADVIPPGADLIYKVRLLHIATEPPFGQASERVLRVKEVLPGRGTPVSAGSTVRVNCRVSRLDGREIEVSDFSGTHEMVLFTGSPLKKAIIGMRTGGLRRMLVNYPNVFGSNHDWFHYGAQLLEVRLEKIIARP